MGVSKERLSGALIIGCFLLQTACTPVDKPQDLGPLISKAEKKDGPWIRDGGGSAKIPGTGDYLVVWGDTFWPGGGSVTATAARGNLGKGLRDVPKAKTPFLPNKNFGFKCSKDAVRVKWPSGLATIPNTKRILIPYMGFCISSKGYRPRTFAMAEYNVDKNKIVSEVIIKKGSPLGKRWRLSNPNFRNGKLYMFWNEDIYEAPWTFVNPIQRREITPDGSSNWWRRISNYGDSKDIGIARGFGYRIERLKGHPDHYGKNVMIRQISGNEYQILSSKSLGSGWEEMTTGKIPGCWNKIKKAHTCRTFNIHPEHSFYPGNLAITAFRPEGDDTRGRSHMFQIPW